MGEILFANGGIKSLITVTWDGIFANAGNTPTPPNAASQMWLYAGGSQVAQVDGPSLPALSPGQSTPLILQLTYAPPIAGYTGQLSARVQVLGHHIDEVLPASIVPSPSGPRYSLGQVVKFTGPPNTPYPLTAKGVVRTINKWAFTGELGFHGEYYLYDIWEGWGGKAWNIPEPWVGLV